MQQDLLLNITGEGTTNTAFRMVVRSSSLPNGNKLDIMKLTGQLDIYSQINEPRKVVSQPWTFLFSAKPNLPSGNNRSYFRFGNNSSLFLDWSSRTFNYEMPNQIDRISIDIDTTQFNHIAFEYVGNKLTVWVNGKSRKSYNIDLPDLSRISINADQLGVLSLYDRELSKTEVAEHFVEYQVKNFSNNAQVLI